MSGGVDSSVAAKLVTDMGFECVGCTMKLYSNEDAGLPKSTTCCSMEDAEQARYVAYKLGMQYYVFDFTAAFRERVIKKFVQSYEAGITPNPCIDCNRFIKFEKLSERARALSCDYIVTGHYARIEHDGSRYVLKKAIDETKDQSYVLYSMTQAQLAHTLFPLGGLRKTEVRKMAEESGFPNAAKPDSQDICFVPNGDYASVIELHSQKGAKPGPFVDSAGHVLGEHRGVIRYTIGQRRGLGLSLSEPKYVCGIYAAENTILLGGEGELYKSVLQLRDFNWISGEAPSGEIRCKARIRYRQNEQWATATTLEGGVVRLCFDEPQRAATPGQAAVLYDGDTVLGGGVIA